MAEPDVATVHEAIADQRRDAVCLVAGGRRLTWTDVTDRPRPPFGRHLRVEQATQLGEQPIHATFVCGKGTQNPPSRFNCVADPQTFPGTAQDGYRNNRSFRPH